ncbi:hypothetical protein ERS044049_02407, partial [Streptococcus pneumoniae]
MVLPQQQWRYGDRLAPKQWLMVLPQQQWRYGDR